MARPRKPSDPAQASLLSTSDPAAAPAPAKAPRARKARAADPPESGDGASAPARPADPDSDSATPSAKAPPARKGRAAKPQSLAQELAAFLDKVLLPDLKARAALPTVDAALRAQHQAERAAHRSAAHYEGFLHHVLTQIGAAWILSCVFLRVLEERGLLRQRRLCNRPGMKDADESLEAFFALAPRLSSADYLLLCLREVAALPAARDLLGPRHNLAWRLCPSAQGGAALLDLFRHDSADRRALYGGDTRFLGDLYQDLSEDARERFALLQTPDFVERFILDLTLRPALRDFGLDGLRVIDPTCGSGHFLLGAFARLCDERERRYPGLSRRENARAALAQVYGVDINPYAVAIARFRLALAFLERAAVSSMAELGELPLQLVVADSLLQGKGQRNLGEGATDVAVQRAFGAELFVLEDREGAQALFGQRYHAVVGNPPYITCKDAELRDEYRKRYDSCHREFALAAPFTEFFFALAEDKGYVGLINANSFMKREFGKKLIEEVLPRYDVERIIDTSGAYIPGHGTPTVLLFGRNQRPIDDHLHTILGIRGEPGTPDVPEQGVVWSTIRDHYAMLNYEDEYISVVKTPRKVLARHPWSLAGGGRNELQQRLEQQASATLTDQISELGSGAVTREDELYQLGQSTLTRLNIPNQYQRPLIEGGDIRDWAIGDPTIGLWPYDHATLKPKSDEPQDAVHRLLWLYRATLSQRIAFGQTQVERGLQWFEYSMFFANRYRTPLSIAYGEISTHNHFVLDRGGKVFKQTAPIIKLPPEATEEDHLALLAYLNSSTACFWMKQVCHDKGQRGQGGGFTSEAWERFFALNGTKIAMIPLPQWTADQRKEAIRRARSLELLAQERQALHDLTAVFEGAHDARTLGDVLALRERAIEHIEHQMRAQQESLDWWIYSVFALAPPPLAEQPPTQPPGARAADVLFAREVIAGGVGRRYFELCRLPPPEEIATDAWVERHGLGPRLAAIQDSNWLALLETPVYKRTFREGFRPLDVKPQAAAWLLDQLEAHLRAQAVHGATCVSLRELSREFLLSPRFIAVSALYSGQNDPDLEAVLNDLVPPESVPYLSIYRYSESGLAKHRAWHHTWARQQQEDQGLPPPLDDQEQPIPVPVPPRYDSEDFRDAAFWRLRGKLDVPRERFVSFPGCERADDPSRVIGWAGWDPVQRAVATMNLFHARKAQETWDNQRLALLLRGVRELRFWLKLWHDQPSPDFDGERPGALFERLLDSEARAIGYTPEALDALAAPAPRPGGPRGRG